MTGGPGQRRLPLLEEGAPVEGAGQHVGAHQALDALLDLLALVDVDQHPVPHLLPLAACQGGGAGLHPAQPAGQREAKLQLPGRKRHRRLGQGRLEPLAILVGQSSEQRLRGIHALLRGEPEQRLQPLAEVEELEPALTVLAQAEQHPGHACHAALQPRQLVALAQLALAHAGDVVLHHQQARRRLALLERLDHGGLVTQGAIGAAAQQHPLPGTPSRQALLQRLGEIPPQGIDIEHHRPSPEQLLRRVAGMALEGRVDLAHHPLVIEQHDRAGVVRQQQRVEARPCGRLAAPPALPSLPEW